MRLVYHAIKILQNKFALFSSDIPRPHRNLGETADNLLTTITPLDLRSSTAKDTRLHRFTTNLPNLSQTIAQSKNDTPSQPSRPEASNTVQKHLSDEESARLHCADVRSCTNCSFMSFLRYVQFLSLRLLELTLDEKCFLNGHTQIVF